MMRWSVRVRLNRALDPVPRTRVRLLSRSWPVFRACCAAGLVSAVALSFGLVAQRGLSPWPMTGIAAGAMATFVLVAWATGRVTGRPDLVLYHHTIAVVLVTAAGVGAAGEPILAYLDVTALGLGLAIAWGRLGCLCVGCCHGRPAAVGLRYGEHHRWEGFTPFLVGERLYPIQLVEAVWLAGVVAVGATLVLGDAPAGATLAWYLMAYAAGRAAFEVLRGDPPRRFYRGVSEAQWTSALVVLAVVALEFAGLLPRAGWHAAAAAAVVSAIAGLAVRAGNTPPSRLITASHAAEVARAARLSSGRAPASGARVRVHETSLGVRISSGRLPGRVGLLHYALSVRDGELTAAGARCVAGVVARLDDAVGTAQVVRRAGVHHVLLRRRTTHGEPR